MMDTEYRAEIPSDLDDLVIGWDRDGDLVAESHGLRYALTPCCHASGKGAEYSESGVVCRSCYSDVSWKYGVPAEDVTLRAEVAR